MHQGVDVQEQLNFQGPSTFWSIEWRRMQSFDNVLAILLFVEVDWTGAVNGIDRKHMYKYLTGTSWC